MPVLIGTSIIGCLALLLLLLHMRRKQQYRYQGVKYKVFISYNHADLYWAEKIKEALERHDIQVTIDIEEFQFGDSIEDSITKAIRNTDYTILIVSEHSLQSPWIIQEFIEVYRHQTVKQQKKFLPIRIDDTCYQRGIDIKIAKERIDPEIKKLSELVNETNAAGLDPEPYNQEIKQLRNLRNTLGSLLGELRKRLVADFTSEDKFRRNLRKLLKNIRPDTYDVLLTYESALSATEAIHKELDNRFGITSWFRGKQKTKSPQDKQSFEDELSHLSIIEKVVIVVATGSETWASNEWRTFFGSSRFHKRYFIPVLLKDVQEIPGDLQNQIKGHYYKPIHFDRAQIRKNNKPLRQLRDAIRARSASPTLFDDIRAWVRTNYLIPGITGAVLLFLSGFLIWKYVEPFHREDVSIESLLEDIDALLIPYAQSYENGADRKFSDIKVKPYTDNYHKKTRIHFDPGKFDLTEVSEPELGNLKTFIQKLLANTEFAAEDERNQISNPKFKVICYADISVCSEETKAKIWDKIQLFDDYDKPSDPSRLSEEDWNRYLSKFRAQTICSHITLFALNSSYQKTIPSDACDGRGVEIPPGAEQSERVCVVESWIEIE